jgi:hypothetical protein
MASILAVQSGIPPGIPPTSNVPTTSLATTPSTSLSTSSNSSSDISEISAPVAEVNARSLALRRTISSAILFGEIPTEKDQGDPGKKGEEGESGKGEGEGGKGNLAKGRKLSRQHNHHSLKKTLSKNIPEEVTNATSTTTPPQLPTTPSPTPSPTTSTPSPLIPRLSFVSSHLRSDSGNSLFSDDSEEIQGHREIDAESVVVRPRSGSDVGLSDGSDDEKSPEVGKRNSKFGTTLERKGGTRLLSIVMNEKPQNLQPVTGVEVCKLTEIEPLIKSNFDRRLNASLLFLFNFILFFIFRFCLYSV